MTDSLPMSCRQSRCSRCCLPPPVLAVLALAALLWAAAAVGAAGGPVALQAQRGAVLVATPRLGDPRFVRSVVLLIDVDDSGALGLVLNRASPYTLGEALPALRDSGQAGQRLFLGGPVERSRIFMLARSDEAPPAAEAVLPGLYVSTAAALATHARALDWGARDWRVVAGYAGWAAGQLAGEIGRGDWRVMRLAPETLFEVPAGALWSVLWAELRGQWVVLPRRGRTG